ncbi:MAG: branched-chain amino acid ABC transporter ATP-binding protein/permease [Giesbergeria sp.]|uniref:branched-chain amino acid ABC transporter ATP-binding protein/permease n=1 Tax=Giesbergeria sp. TaxID=2818473 RepID=UPI00262BA4C4|nr:branched-chain amino acid ABC transporter ATP-binding protein/permease [Giesbergeria sp.]MDD2610402.1 branched-chain amino acid ABC transporter ATP-binding protein/permease [Giesbergeria sp.]
MRLLASLSTKKLQWLVFAWFFLFPFLPVPSFWVTLGNYIGLYSIAALGLVLLTGVGGLTSFGQAAFVGLGAYTTAYLSTTLGWSPWLGLPMGLLVSGAAALAIGAMTVRLSGHYLPLATIAWSLSLYYLFGTLEFLGKYDGISGIPPLTLFGFDLSNPRVMYGLIWFCLGGCVWLVLNLLNSRPGRAIHALAKGKTMPEAMGIHTAQYKVLVFVLAALMASLSGWLYAHLQRSVSATPFGLNMGIEYLFMAVVGGVGHVWGAILGAGLLTGLKSQLQDWLPLLLGSNGNYEMLFFGIMVILLLHHARYGIWPNVTALWARVHPPEPEVVAPEIAPEGYSDMPRRAKPAPGSIILEVNEARKQFGGLVAVKDMQFDLRAGEIVGLIGPNGAGKSTMFNLVTGVLPVTSGEIRFCGERIDTLDSRRIVQRGIGRSFQHVHLIPHLSVLENVAMGTHLRGHMDPVRAALRLDRAEEARLLYLAAEQIKRVGLGEFMHTPAGSLALGQQRILEIARALCTDPVLLLLDEPAAGLRLKEKQALSELLKQLKSEGMSVLLVEHDMDFVMGITDRLVVMEFGSKIAEGLPTEIQNNEAVLAAYLGGIE